MSGARGVFGGVVTAVMFAGAVVACSSGGSSGSNVEVTSAMYAENCGAATDVTAAIQAACKTTPCSCGKSCFAGSSDPAYGCEKGLSVMYVVGGVEHTVTCAPLGGEGYVFAIATDGTGSCNVAPSSSSSSGSSGNSKECTSDSQCSSHCSSSCYECHSGSCSGGYEGSDGCVF